MNRLSPTAAVLLALLFVPSGCKPDRVEHNGTSGGMTYHEPPDVHIEEDRLRVDTRIHFAFDSDEILPESGGILDQISQVLNHHTEITAVTLVGHTDAAGGPEHNQDLSERRAASVAAALRQRGVQQTLEPRGVGETQPICQEDTEECHAQNRRVEFLIVTSS